MSTRIPLPYTPKVLEIFRNPRNVGPMEDADVVESAGSPACGDMIRLYLKISTRGGDEVIEKATFESYGCAANIAAASILTDLVAGRTVKEAWGISWKSVADELGGLPPIKYHCSILAVGALKRAIRAYYGKLGKHPEWLPKDLTIEERQTLEEEQMIERIYSGHTSGYSLRIAIPRGSGGESPGP
ncbi:MAG: iron-sulfur cluster assembly scaffold protein [Sulfolobales archaeon]|nr:iron-sulfur cluster assembly scaffold protein [Sulfolobales archaeon]MCX8208465.1 iron-sulfur cluster assembly scaffold protein [Sulfolobales archaeon]MDW8010227.1 iron-sulfur cluster assembly scaffold protein [Sulfolobales archaeon]